MKNYFSLILFIFSSLLSAHSTDLVIFSFDRPLQLYALLESLDLYTTDINAISIVYRSSNERFDNAFNEVARQFPSILFLRQQSVHDFKELTVQAVERSPSDYITFAVDDNVVKEQISFVECIEWLEKANAYGFYLKLGTHLNHCYTENKPQAVPPYDIVHNSICSWDFDLGKYDWHYPNTVDMTVYRKKDFIDIFRTLDYTSPNFLESKWAAWWVTYRAPSNKGLFYQNSKILNIPMNKVQTDINNRDMNLYTPQELLELFEAGYKMDIRPLYQMENKAVHTEYEPTFIMR